MVFFNSYPTKKVSSRGTSGRELLCGESGHIAHVKRTPMFIGGRGTEAMMNASGRGEIRTHETLTGLRLFESRGFSRSPTLPCYAILQRTELLVNNMEKDIQLRLRVEDAKSFKQKMQSLPWALFSKTAMRRAAVIGTQNTAKHKRFLWERQFNKYL